MEVVLCGIRQQSSSHGLQGPGAEVSAPVTLRRTRQGFSDRGQRNRPGEGDWNPGPEQSTNPGLE